MNQINTNFSIRKISLCNTLFKWKKRNKVHCCAIAAILIIRNYFEKLLKDQWLRMGFFLLSFLHFFYYYFSWIVRQSKRHTFNAALKRVAFVAGYKFCCHFSIMHPTILVNWKIIINSKVFGSFQNFSEVQTSGFTE